MSPKRRRMSALPWVALSLLLIALPSSLTQSPRLLVMSAFTPFRNLAHRSARLCPASLSSGEAQELLKKVEYLEDLVVKEKNQRESLESKLAQVAGLGSIVKEDGYKVLYAAVLLPADSSAWRNSLTLSIGTRGGARKGMWVLYNNQLVGRILEPGPFASRVQLVTDPGFRVRAVAAPKTYTAGVSFGKRQAGVFEGTSADRGRLKWFAGDTPVENGAYVLTTEDPLSRIPAGLTLGRVSKLINATGASPWVEVEPILNFRGLETVMLLHRPGETP